MIDGIIELLKMGCIGEGEARIRGALVCEDFEWIDFEKLSFIKTEASQCSDYKIKRLESSALLNQ